MLKFKIKNIIPPGGVYFYEVPETKVVLKKSSMRELLSSIEAHLTANDHPVPKDLRALVEDYICRNVPEGFCFGDAGDRPRARVVTLESIQAGTKAAVKAGGGLVDPGQARKRVDNCSACKHNDRRMCPTCIGLVSWARRLVGTECPRDQWLGVCDVDSVALPAKVHLKKVAENPDYPPSCWVPRGE